MSTPDQDALRSTIHAALLTSIQEELGEDVRDRSQLLECYTSLKRTLSEVPSPTTEVISDMGYRAILAAELEAIFMELYDAARDSR
jgi:hypothetical protein